MSIVGDSPLQTTGGLLTKEDYGEVIKTICEVFDCTPNEIKSIAPLQKGLSNVLLSFWLRGGSYVYRHSGLGAEILIDRGRESILQKIVEDAGIDHTLISMSVRYGWRISRYIEARPFDYHNLNDVVRGIGLLRKLHNAPTKVRWEFDIWEKAEYIKNLIPQDQYGQLFDGFHQIKENIFRLYQLAKTDGIKKCLCHGDCRDENFLINDREIHLIDWEYAGYADPGFDIGTYICGGEHTDEDIQRILYIYFCRAPTAIEKRHFIAYIAIAGYFYMNWTMFKESEGQIIGNLKRLWYHYAKTYSKIALTLYESEA